MANECQEHSCINFNNMSTYRMAFTSGELLDMPTGVMGLMRKRSFLLLQSFAGAAGSGLKSFNMVATGTYIQRRKPLISFRYDSGMQTQHKLVINRAIMNPNGPSSPV